MPPPDDDRSVYLYRVGRNLNRAYRTAEAFGIGRIVLVDCPATEVRGNLYRAAGRVEVIRIDDLPRDVAMPGVCGLETDGDTPIWSIPWPDVKSLLIGGETAGLPRRFRTEWRATIPMAGLISGLTVEAALAIALHEWTRPTPASADSPSSSRADSGGAAP